MLDNCSCHKDREMSTLIYITLKLNLGVREDVQVIKYKKTFLLSEKFR